MCKFCTQKDNNFGSYAELAHQIRSQSPQFNSTYPAVHGAASLA